jgi:serine/threonine protein kinase
MPDPFAQQTIPSAAPRYHQGRKMFGGRYTLLKPLGRGGMGEVWLAQDNELGVQRALKFAPPEVAADARSVAMLKREAIAGTSLAHPNIVRIFDFAHDAAAMESAVVMEVVEGKSLAELQAKRIEESGNGFFEPEEITEWVQDICSALDYAHREGRVHRDLKPQNLMVETASNHVKIMDFGISRRVGDSLTQLTNKDSSGTLAYCSPQQAAGGRFSPADDIYGLGATLYDLLTGSPPFTGPALRELVLEKAPAGLNERRHDMVTEGGQASTGSTISGDWEQAVLACLAKDPARRPANAAAFLKRLHEASTQSASVAARQQVPSVGRHPGARRKTALLTAAVLLVVAIISAAIWMNSGKNETPPAESGRSAAAPSPPAQAEKTGAPVVTPPSKPVETTIVRPAPAPTPAPSAPKTTATAPTNTPQFNSDPALEEKLIAAWRSVRAKNSIADLEAAKTLFQSVQSHADPIIAYQGEAGLAAIESLIEGIPPHGVELWPVSKQPMVPTRDWGLVSHLSRLWGYIDKEGKEVIAADFDDAAYFSEGLGCVKKGGDYYIIDSKKSLTQLSGVRVSTGIISTRIRLFNEGLLKVSRDGHGFVDRKGKEVIPPTWYEVGNFSEGLARAGEQFKAGFINRKGNLVIPLEWEQAGDFCEGLAPVQRAGEAGFIDRRGHLVWGLKWDHAESFSEGLAMVRQDNAVGFIDRRGQMVISASWDRAGSFHEGLAWVRNEDSSYGYIDQTGKVIIPLGSIEVVGFPGDFSENLAAFSKSGKYGFIDHLGKTVVPPVWGSVGDFRGGLAMVLEHLESHASDTAKEALSARMCYIDKTGRVIWSSDGKGIGTYGPLGAVEGKAQPQGGKGAATPMPEAKSVADNPPQMLPTTVGSAKMIQPAPMETALAVVAPADAMIEENLIEAWRKARARRSLDELTAAKKVFESARKHPNPVISYQGDAGMAAVDVPIDPGMQLWPLSTQLKMGRYSILDSWEYSDSKVWGFIDRNGRAAVPPQWNHAKNFSEGLARVRKRYSDGYIDSTGKEVMPPRWNEAREFHNGLAAVRNEKDKWGFIDRAGNQVISAVWENAFEFSENLAGVRKGDLWGVIDRTGALIAPPQWDFVWSYSEGLAPVQKKYLSGYIDRSGKEVIPLRWGFAGPFCEGLACVRSVEKSGFIDRTGKEVIPRQWESAGTFSEGLAYVSAAGKCGFIDRSGKLVIQPLWESAADFSEGLARVKSGGKWGFIDRSGKVIVPPVWTDANGFVGGLARVIEAPGPLPTDIGKTITVRMCYIDTTGKVIWSSGGKGIGTYGPGRTAPSKN